MAPPPPPGSRDFTATAGRSVGERRIGTQCLRFLPRQAPSWDRVALQAQVNGPRYRRSPSHVPCKSGSPGSRRLYAGCRLASRRASARLVPGEYGGPLVLTSSNQFRRFNNDAQAGHPSLALLVRLPEPHLTHPVRLFPLAHHDGLQPTQQRVVWRLPPQADAGGPTSISRTASLSEVSYIAPPSVFVTHPYDGHGRYTALDPSRLQPPNCAGGVPRVQERLILARSSARRPMQASSKSTAESRAYMLRKSGRQQAVKGPRWFQPHPTGTLRPDFATDTANRARK